MEQLFGPVTAAFPLLLSALLVSSCYDGRMSAYHVDSLNGNDRNTGKSPAEAWKTLRRAMKQKLGPGDSLLLKRGCSWNESLRIRGSGKRGRPITLGTYGPGPKPRLVSKVFPIVANDGPVSWWHIKGLEVRGATSFDPFLKGLGRDSGIALYQSAPSVGMVIEDCVVHDVSGSGIVIAAGAAGRTVFRDWLVTRCEVYNAGTGIATHGPWPPSADMDRFHRCHSNFRVTHCRTHDMVADGIVLSHCRDGVIEHCAAWRTGIGRVRRTPVGIWFFMARRCVIQFCESFDNHPAGGKADGGGFDLDGGCVECVMQYNYSHDNDGAGYLICSYDPVNAPCIKCVTRFNLSVNDGRMNDYPAILFWQAVDCVTYNNTCITRISSPLKFTSDTSGHLIANNIFVVDSGSDIPVVKSAFAMDANTFRNNLYWRTGGKARFEIQAAKNLGMPGFAALVQSRGEKCADPGLTALSGHLVLLRKGSPCTGAGTRLPGMGRRDLYGTAPGGSGQVNIGCSLARPR